MLEMCNCQSLKFPVASSPLATNTCDLARERGPFGRLKIQCGIAHMVVLLFVRVGLTDCVKPQNLPFVTNNNRKIYLPGQIEF